MMHIFQSYHPAVAAIYFAAVIIFSVILMHPVFLAISFAAALAYALYLKGMKAIKFCLAFVIPAFIVLALINPMFNHRGMTILFYTQYNPITLESILYGLAAAAMLVTVVVWFISYNEVMSSDKFIYLFGKLSPAVALIISMTLRLVPRLKHQIQEIAAAQRTIGKDMSGGGLLARIKHGLAILSSLISWALENSIETADSMKARGYGLRGRTSFSIFRFTLRDGVALGILSGCIAGCAVIAAGGGIAFQYYPYLKWAEAGPVFVAAALLYALLCFFPLILEAVELIKWKCFE